MIEPLSLPRAKGESEAAFSHLRHVRPDEMDELDHVSNVSYVQWVQDIAHDHTNLLGYTIAKYKEIGGIFVVQRHDIEYSAPTFTGETLRIVTWVDGWRPYYCTRHTHILRMADGARAAKCETTWVWLGLPSGRPKRIPAEIVEAFSRAPDPALCGRMFEGGGQKQNKNE